MDGWVSAWELGSQYISCGKQFQLSAFRKLDKFLRQASFGSRTASNSEQRLVVMLLVTEVVLIRN